MATASDGGQYGISIRYGDKSKPFHFSGEQLVSFVIKKAASELQISFAERPKLILVYMGSPLPKDSTLNVRYCRKGYCMSYHC